MGMCGPGEQGIIGRVGSVATRLRTVTVLGQLITVGRLAQREAKVSGAFVYVITDIINELSEAESKYAPMHSAHEGFAILKEEVDELWDEVKRKPDAIRREAMRKEAVQVAAMALRFIQDVCDKKDET
jgi:hypothetical protein